METITNVEKEIEVKVEQGREQLVALKNMAYDKYCDAWNSMEQVKESTLDTLRSAWEQAWLSYSSVVRQLKEYGYTAIEKATAEYDLARENLAERTKELQTWIIDNGQKLRDESSDIQVETAHKLHEARKEAYEKYILSRDALKRMFLSSQVEAKEDLRNAKEQLRKTKLNLERHLKNSTDTNSEEFERTKLKLEEAKTLAEKELEDAKAHSHTLYDKISTWSDDVLKILSEQSEFLSQRVLQMRDQLMGVASESKEKVEDATEAAGKVMSNTWEQIFNSLKDESVYAYDKLKQFKDSVQESLKGALEAAEITDTKTPVLAEKKQEQTASPKNVALA